MSAFTHDGWLRAAPAQRTRPDAPFSGRRSIRTATPGRAPHSAITTVPEPTLEDSNACHTCHMTLPTTTGVCDGLWH